MSKESAVDAMRRQKDAEMTRLKASRSQTSHAALTLKSQFDELKTSYLGLVKQVRQFPNVISKTINILRTEVMLCYSNINNETRLKKQCYLIRQDNTVYKISIKLLFSSWGQEKSKLQKQISYLS